MPICAEVFKSRNAYNPKRLFGVTTLDVVRASRFISQLKGTDPADENITVIGGHSGATIVPLLSQAGYSLEGKELDDFVYRVQFGGDEVVKAKDGAGSATLSMAMAGARFAESLLKAAQGQKGVVEPTFVDSPLYKGEGIDFFASKVELGPNGVEKVMDVGKITPFEQKLLDACKTDLKKNIEKGMFHILGRGTKMVLTALQVLPLRSKTPRLEPEGHWVGGYMALHRQISYVEEKLWYAVDFCIIACSQEPFSCGSFRLGLHFNFMSSCVKPEVNPPHLPQASSSSRLA